MSEIFTIGCHLSTSKGFLNMGKEIMSIGGNTFQFFTRNPRGGSAKPIDVDDIAAFREFAINTFADDLERMEYLPGNLYNFHPGSHVKQGVDVGIDYIVEALNKVIKPEQTTTVLLETMAGKGSEIGRTFEEIKRIIDRVELNDHLGVCLDTCHVYDGEYDIVNNLDGVLNEFNEIIGINRLKAVHINDSKNPFGSHKDRHEKIGEGSIGVEAFRRIINHPDLRDLPFYLETPNELDGYAKEIALLKSLRA